MVHLAAAVQVTNLFALHTNKHRAVGWHLMTGRDKATLDCQALKSHVEEVEGVLEKEKAEWAQQQDAIKKQVAEIKVG